MMRLPSSVRKGYYNYNIYVRLDPQGGYEGVISEYPGWVFLGNSIEEIASDSKYFQDYIDACLKQGLPVVPSFGRYSRRYEQYIVYISMIKDTSLAKKWFTSVGRINNSQPKTVFESAIDLTDINFIPYEEE